MSFIQSFRNMMRYFMNVDVKQIYFDFETTGLNPYHSKIIDFCFLKEPLTSDIDDSFINDINKHANSDFILNENYFSSLVNPEEKLKSKITEITNITSDMLVNKQTINQLASSINDFINVDNCDVYFIAHNCHGFDEIFFKRTMADNGFNLKDYNYKFIDSLYLAKKLKPDMFSYSLKTLCNYYKIQEGKHRALSDCVALREVYIKLLEVLSNKIDTPVDVMLKNPEIVYNYLYEY